MEKMGSLFDMKVGIPEQTHVQKFLEVAHKLKMPQIGKLHIAYVSDIKGQYLKQLNAFMSRSIQLEFGQRS